jgi:hypothetical protein
MFGYACNETPELIPPPSCAAPSTRPRTHAHRKSGKVKWLRPTPRARFRSVPRNDQPREIINVVISTQHAHDAEHKTIKEFCMRGSHQEDLAEEIAYEEHDLPHQSPWPLRGRRTARATTGLTGRKIIVDSYGGMGRHGGGAFSGKDPSKVDRSAAYMGRYVAKNIVAAGIATSAEIQFAYAIGYPEPVSVCINTFGTAAAGVTDEQIEKGGARRSLASSPRTSLNSSTCSARFTRRRPTTATSAKPTPTSRGKKRTRPATSAARSDWMPAPASRQRNPPTICDRSSLTLNPINLMPTAIKLSPSRRTIIKPSNGNGKSKPDFAVRDLSLAGVGTQNHRGLPARNARASCPSAKSMA